MESRLYRTRNVCSMLQHGKEGGMEISVTPGDESQLQRRLCRSSPPAPLQVSTSSPWLVEVVGLDQIVHNIVSLVLQVAGFSRQSQHLALVCLNLQLHLTRGKPHNSLQASMRDGVGCRVAGCW